MLSCDLPTHVEAEITYTEPGIKGDTATNTLKPATTDTGLKFAYRCSLTWCSVKVNTRSKVRRARQVTLAHNVERLEQRLEVQITS